MRLEDLTVDVVVDGVVPGVAVTVVRARWHGADALTLTYREASGRVLEQTLFREDEPRLSDRPTRSGWTFDADPHEFRLASEATRIRLASLVDPMLAVTTSDITPLPHQIQAVYGELLQKPGSLDDPGAGKTIMAGLFIKELGVFRAHPVLDRLLEAGHRQGHRRRRLHSGGDRRLPHHLPDPIADPADSPYDLPRLRTHPGDCTQRRGEAPALARCRCAGGHLGNFGSALEMLSQQATYLYADAGRYWYDTTPSVTRTAADIADRLREEPERVWAEVIDGLRTHHARGGRTFAGVHIAPETTADVPDTENTRLVVVHPKHTYAKDGASTARTFAERCLTSVGTGQRTRRNTIVFVAADRARYEELDAAVRDALAWRQISDQVVELNLTEQQKAQVRTRYRQSEETVTYRITATYVWAIVPVQPEPTAPPSVRAEKVPEGPAPLPDRVGDKLKRAEEIATDYSPLRIRMALDHDLAAVWTDGHVRVGELWDYYTSYPYLDRLRDRTVLDAALTMEAAVMWQSEGFALASGHDGDRYTGLALPGDSVWPPPISDTTLVVRPDRAVAQRAADDARVREETERQAKGGGSGAAAAGGGDGETGVRPGRVAEPGPGVGGVAPPVPEPMVKRRYFGTRILSPERYSAEFSKITQEIIQHLTSTPGVHLEVRLEITAEAPRGFTHQTIRTVRENAQQLRFEQSGFEEL